MTLRELRRLVGIERVLEHRGLTEDLTRRGHRLVGPCPVHGGDNPTAFVADCRRGLWNCFTVCGGGDVVELIRALDQVTYAQVARTLTAMAGRTPARPPSPPPTVAEPFRAYTRRLDLEPAHPFLAARGIHPTTARRFEVGAWRGRGMLQGCVAVRLHDTGCRPLGYAGRRLKPDRRGKWVFPRRLPKSSLLYGWHRLPSRDQLVIVEGPWEVLRLHQLGVPAVALLGTHFSREQIEMLRGSRCWILLDGDDAGRVAAGRLARVLAAPVIELPFGCDPADLRDQQLIGLIQPIFSPNQPHSSTVPTPRT